MTRQRIGLGRTPSRREFHPWLRLNDAYSTVSDRGLAGVLGLAAPPDEGGLVLGLPRGVTACLYDLDEGLTNTALMHEQSWKPTFDASSQGRGGATASPFAAREDHRVFADGKRREDSVRDFWLRGAFGALMDGPATPRAHRRLFGLGNHKNALLVESIRKNRVDVYAGSRRHLQAAREAGLQGAVVSS